MILSGIHNSYSVIYLVDIPENPGFENIHIVAGRPAYIIAEINKAAAVTEGFVPTGVDVGINPGWLAKGNKTTLPYKVSV